MDIRTIKRGINQLTGDFFFPLIQAGKFEVSIQGSPKDIQLMLDAYIETALWASVDENGDPLDKRFTREDLVSTAIEQMRKDCEAFYNDNKETLLKANSDFSQHGHDFWLTHNGHGVGFWDRGYRKEISNALTKAAYAYGDAYLYVGDDNNLYHS